MMPAISRIIYASDLGDNAPTVFASAVSLARTLPFVWANHLGPVLGLQ